MNNPKTIWIEPGDADYFSQDSEPHGIRYVLADGEEVCRLISEARKCAQRHGLPTEIWQLIQYIE